MLMWSVHGDFSKQHRCRQPAMQPAHLTKVSGTNSTTRLHLPEGPLTRPVKGVRMLQSLQSSSTSREGAAIPIPATTRPGRTHHRRSHRPPDKPCVPLTAPQRTASKAQRTPAVQNLSRLREEQCEGWSAGTIALSRTNNPYQPHTPSARPQVSEWRVLFSGCACHASSSAAVLSRRHTRPSPPQPPVHLCLVPRGRPPHRQQLISNCRRCSPTV
jgi:hypothetical protein